MHKEEKYKHYAEKVKLFHGLKPDEVATILHEGKLMHFREGETIFHEGMLGSNLFIVLSGEIAIYLKNELIAKCEVGDAFGEMAVLNSKPRSATAAALTEVKLFTLDESHLNGILDQHVAVRLLLNIIHVLSERLEWSNARMARSKLLQGKGR